MFLDVLAPNLVRAFLEIVLLNPGLKETHQRDSKIEICIVRNRKTAAK